MIETWGLPNMDSKSGWLCGAELTYIEAPIRYSRMLSSWHTQENDAKELQYDFLRDIDAPRFLEIQKATGAFQGKNPPNRNQLLDAFHLWCADHAGCEVFLTGEAEKLRGLIARKKNFSLGPKVLKPSELLELLGHRRHKKLHYRFAQWLGFKI